MNFLPRGYGPAAGQPSPWMVMQPPQPPLPGEQIPFAPGVDVAGMLPPDQIPYAPGYQPSPGDMGAFEPQMPLTPSPASRSGPAKPTYRDFLLQQREAEEAAAELMRQRAQPSRELMSALAGQETQVDLSPLAALVDQWSGSSLARGYQKPESGGERLRTLQGVAGDIDRRELGAEQAEVEALRRFVQGNFQADQTDADQAYKNQMLGLQREQNAISAAKAGAAKPGKTLGDSSVANYTSSQGAIKMAGDLQKTITNYAKLMGPAEGKKAMWPWNEGHKTLQGEFDLVRQKIGKMIEGGVLRAEDEKKYVKILPTITDTPQVAIEKARKMEAMLKVDLGRYMENYGRAGYDVSGFADQTAQYQREAAGALSQNAPSPAGGGDSDSQAVAWAKANPGDPRSARILQLNGAR